MSEFNSPNNDISGTEDVSSPPDVIIRALIFDVDDTLYDKSTGFTYHRNNDGVQQFMVNELHFPTRESAKELRDEYFQKYHSTAKALLIAEQDGKFPLVPLNIVDDNNSDNNNHDNNEQSKSKLRFDPKMLDIYFATQLNFTLLGGEKSTVAKELQELSLQYKLIAFSNGPRNYIKRVLKEIGLWNDSIFNDTNLFAVTDTLPYCKPDKEAFYNILEKNKLQPNQCIMIEDSMKNIHIAKELGMKTILVTGKGVINDIQSGTISMYETKHDLPNIYDTDVDAVIETIEDLKTDIPGLWETPINLQCRIKANQNTNTSTGGE